MPSPTMTAGRVAQSAYTTMHEETRLNLRTIQHALRRLVQFGEVTRDTPPNKRRGKPVVYRFRPKCISAYG